MNAFVTDVQIGINAVLEVEEPDPRLITNGQTTGRSCVGGKFFEAVGDYNYKAIYVLNPVALKGLAG